MVRVVPLRDDTAFKKSFGQSAIFCQLAQDVLDIEFHATEVHQGYKYLKPVSQVDIKYDLFAEDPNSRIVVEIQHIKEHNFYNRFLYYHIIGLADQVKNSYAYNFNQTVYTIVVLTSPSGESEIDFSFAITDFNPINEFNRKVEVYPHQLVFLGPRMVNEHAPPGIKSWLEIILASLNGEIDETRYSGSIFEQVIDAVKFDNISPQEFRVLKDEGDWEGALTFRHNQGLTEGKQQEKEAIARALISEGLSTELIAITTGLSEAEMETLRRT